MSLLPHKLNHNQIQELVQKHLCKLNQKNHEFPRQYDYIKYDLFKISYVLFY